jgi:hypothetical protein
MLIDMVQYAILGCIIFFIVVPAIGAVVGPRTSGGYVEDLMFGMLFVATMLVGAGVIVAAVWALSPPF